MPWLNGDNGACGWHLFVCPGGWIRPASAFDGRRTLLLSRLNNSEYAYKKKCWNEQFKKQRAMCFCHGIYPRTCMVTQNLCGKG